MRTDCSQEAFSKENLEEDLNNSIRWCANWGLRHVDGAESLGQVWITGSMVVGQMGRVWG